MGGFSIVVFVYWRVKVRIIEQIGNCHAMPCRHVRPAPPQQQMLHNFSSMPF